MKAILQANEDVTTLQNAEANTIRIGLVKMQNIPTVGTNCYQSFRVWRPEFEISYVTYRAPDMIEALMCGEVDAAILFFKETDDRFFALETIDSI